MKLIPAVFSLSLLLPIMNACGVESNTSEVKSPNSLVYRYNASGANGAIEAFRLMEKPCDTTDPIAAGFCTRPIVEGDSVKLVTMQNWDGGIIVGPYATFQPGKSGIGHIAAEVELEAVAFGPQDDGSSVIVDLVSGNPAASIVHDTQVVQLKVSAGRIIVPLRANPFREPLVNVEVRVRDLKRSMPLGFNFYSGSPIVKIHETRIIYN